MTRLLPFVLLVACAAPKPVVGPAAVKAQPNGAAVIADADARWEKFTIAQGPALEVALAEADAKAGKPAPESPMTTRTPAVKMESTPRWLPDKERFMIHYAYQQTVTVQWSEPGGGCTKYQNWPSNQPSPQPCPPPMPIMMSRSYAVEMGLELEYTADGKLVTERPAGAAPVQRK